MILYAYASFYLQHTWVLILITSGDNEAQKSKCALLESRMYIQKRLLLKIQIAKVPPKTSCFFINIRNNVELENRKFSSGLCYKKCIFLQFFISDVFTMSGEFNAFVIYIQYSKKSYSWGLLVGCVVFTSCVLK